MPISGTRTHAPTSRAAPLARPMAPFIRAFERRFRRDLKFLRISHDGCMSEEQAFNFRPLEFCAPCGGGEVPVFLSFVFSPPQ